MELSDIRYCYYTNSIFIPDRVLDIRIPDKFTRKVQNMPYMVKAYEQYPFIDGKDNQYMVMLNDGYENYGIPCFHKVRKITEPQNAILHKNIDFGRHWGPFYKQSDNIHWTNKQSAVVWRGAPTNKNVRIDFCHRYYHKYNIGLSRIFNHMKDYNINHLIKNTLTYEEMIAYKFLISIEGNDKDSGLNWKLASNSLVIMPVPKLESWLMEGLLEPWKHYVPLSDDLSDLDEVLDWCLSNDDECRSIVENAHTFLNQFRDINQENVLLQRIEQDYYQYINLQVKD